MVSAKLSPAARTAIRTSPAPTAGSGHSWISSTFGPPVRVKTTAFMTRNLRAAPAPLAAAVPLSQHARLTAAGCVVGDGSSHRRTPQPRGIDMGRDESALDRRTLLAGALGTVGVVITGCSAPPRLNGPNAEPARSSTPGLLPGTANPSPVITSAQPRSHPSAATEPASSREIIKRATVPVLCYHQLRNWQSGDSQYNRLNLICPPKYFRAHLDALAEDGWTTISPAHYLRHLDRRSTTA